MGKKGNNAELEVARLLEAWWRQLEPNAVMVRTPRSGGWTQGRDHFQARGDLMVQHAPRFHWTVEVKRRERWSLDAFEAGRRSPVWGWWTRASHDAACAGQAPMLWFRQNRRRWIVMVPALPGQRPALPRMADFAWDEGKIPFDPEDRVPHPRAFWEDRFLAIHPRQWL